MAPLRRDAGPPPSSNEASSFHARWITPGTPLRAVSAVFEVSRAPAVEALYFWALQVSFASGPVRRGAGHLGLQHHPSYPGGGAINWGGYHDPSTGGGQLEGSSSPLRSTLGNPNTFDYPWLAGRRYRLQIARTEPGWWRATVTDLVTDDSTIIRELFCEADHMVDPMVWSEVFADCDAPPVEVRWSAFAAATVDGTYLEPEGVALTYQQEHDGGCSNTATDVADGWLIQRTNSERIHQHGATLSW